MLTLHVRALRLTPQTTLELARHTLWTLAYKSRSIESIDEGYEFEAESTINGVEIWMVSDVVSNINSSHPKIRPNDVLLSPANPYLVGTKLPYFPVGGPLPDKNIVSTEDEASSSKWGGLEVGSLMRYPTQAIDGRVHFESGSALKQFLTALPTDKNGHRLPVGKALMTEAIGGLQTLCGFEYIIHTAPPLAKQHYEFKSALAMHVKKDVDITTNGLHQMLLTRCYENSLQIFINHAGMRTLVTALIGSGTAGNATATCVSALKAAIDRYKHPQLILSAEGCIISNNQRFDDADASVSSAKVVRIALQDESIRDELIAALVN